MGATALACAASVAAATPVNPDANATTLAPAPPQRAALVLAGVGVVGLLALRRRRRADR